MSGGGEEKVPLPARPLLTVSEERLGQLAEESLEQAADDVEVLPALRRNGDVRTQTGSQGPPSHVHTSSRTSQATSAPDRHAGPEHILDYSGPVGSVRPATRSKRTQMRGTKPGQLPRTASVSQVPGQRLPPDAPQLRVITL